MRKVIILLAVALMLTGCSGKPAEKPEPAVAEPVLTEPAETELSKPQENLTGSAPIVAFQVEQKEFFSQKEPSQKLLTYSFPWVKVNLSQNPAVGESITVKLREENSKLLKGLYDEGDPYAAVGMDQARQYAEESYQELGEYFDPFALERSCQVSAGNGRILSLTFKDYMNLGGAHGSTIEKSYNFDLQTGEFLRLEDLTEQKEAFRQALVSYMVKLTAENPEIEDRIDWFEPQEYEKAFLELLRDGSWKFSEGDLIISSLQYELGSYAAGTIAFRIPAENLKTWLKSEYLPEKPEEGLLILSEQSSLPVMDQVPLGENPVELFLEAQGTVYDLQLTPLSLLEDGSGSFPGHPIWYCGKLENSAVKLSVSVPETIPNLMVSFRLSDGAFHKGMLTQSGEDGHYFLINGEDIYLPQ